MTTPEESHEQRPRGQENRGKDIDVSRCLIDRWLGSSEEARIEKRWLSEEIPSTMTASLTTDPKLHQYQYPAFRCCFPSLIACSGFPRMKITNGSSETTANKDTLCRNQPAGTLNRKSQPETPQTPTKHQAKWKIRQISKQASTPREKKKKEPSIHPPRHPCVISSWHIVIVHLLVYAFPSNRSPKPASRHP